MTSTNPNSPKTFEDVTEFHGHVCPGSVLGFKAANLALRELSSEKSIDEKLVCMVENDSCAVDAIQVVTGCTFGKGNLIFNDFGKQTYTFINRNSGEGVRVSMKKTFSMDNIDPELNVLRSKVSAGTASTQEKEMLPEKVAEVTAKMLEMDGEEIFDAEKVKVEVPPRASLYKSVACDECGEMVSEHRVKKEGDNKLCIPCFESLSKE